MEAKDRIYLLDRLWELQQAHGYLSDADVAQAAAEFGLSAVDVEGVASFYHFYQRRPAGRFTIYLNNSILSCHSGFDDVKAALEKETGATFGTTDPSGTFGLFETSCIGLSDREPAALINFYPFTYLTAEKVSRIISGLKAGKSAAELADEVEENVRFVPPSDKAVLLRDYVPGKALEQLQSFSSEQVIAAIKDSGLSGRGGAFFPTGLKWELCRNAAGAEKYIVCNADEGEPGTFKDRALLQLYPGLLFEGMLVAGYAVGAHVGIIYLRAEYQWLLPKLNKALVDFREKAILGKPLPQLQNFSFDIRVQVGAGAYICGEETALLESLEGKRGEPRLKTFFPTEKGFCGKPTVVNNVETFCSAARIIELGEARYKALGTPSSTGTKLLSVAGDCSRPGIYEIEWGMKVSELLELCGARNPQYIQMSGPSGELIAAEEKDRTISCEDIRCGGSVMVFDTSRDLFTILLNYTSFFAYESCGLCTPCRAGNPQLLHMLQKLSRGRATAADLAQLQDWCDIIKHNSRCGLGQSAPNPIEQALHKFPELFRQKLAKSELFNPGFDLEKATHAYDQLTHGK